MAYLENGGGKGTCHRIDVRCAPPSTSEVDDWFSKYLNCLKPWQSARALLIPLSHGSIVAREYGIPAVLGTGAATTRISHGQTITVDGTDGRVYLTIKI